jgi:hypothetical protein
VALALGFSLVLAACSSADPTTADEARTAVEGWLSLREKPLGVALGREVDRVETHADVAGVAMFYVVYLKPHGFVIAPADDAVEPVIGFSAGGRFDPSDATPFGALVTRDVPGRVEAVRRRALLTQDAAPTPAPFQAAHRKWRDLRAARQDLMDEGRRLKIGLSGVSDVRVDPLIPTRWGQERVGGQPCYNYYTPNNYPSGCLATALAQLMRFWEHPAAAVGTASFAIKVDGQDQTASLRGGDGSGGPYPWSAMPLTPDASLTLAQRQAIGALCHDAGVASHMQYASGGSGAYVNDARIALLNTFGFGNAIDAWNRNNDISGSLDNIANPNLDAGFPVILGIVGGNSGHAALCDGYGYDAATLYHHLNMGWSGVSDAWYDLPRVDAYYSYDSVDECLYNIYVTGSGEVISGRVTDASGAPVSQATVTATRAGGGAYTADTNGRGIYALPNVPSASQYSVTAARSGLLFSGRTVTTGTSTNGTVATGNRWGVDFAGSFVTRMSVEGGGREIASGDSTPSSEDQTDFGVAHLDAGSVTRTFTIRNQGVLGLQLTGTPVVQVGGAQAGDFTVISAPSATVPSGGSTTFQMRFGPGGSGVRQAQVSIPNNSDQNPYTFAIQGTGSSSRAYTCVPTYALLSAPMSQSGIATAEDLCRAVPNCTGVWKWDAVIQNWVGHPLNGPNNFAVTDGMACMAAVSAGGSAVFAGNWASPVYALKAGYNLVSLPRGKASLTTVEALAQDVPGCTGVWRWDATLQNWVGHPRGGPNNFPLDVGDACLVYVAADATWP